MSKQPQGKPWITLIVGAALLGLGIGMFIFKLMLPMMPDLFIFLGIIFLVPGINLLYDALKKMREIELQEIERKKIASAASVETNQVSGIKVYISDEELHDNYQKTRTYAILCWLFAAILAPLMLIEVFSGNPPGPQSFFFVIPMGLSLPFTYYVSMYKNNPEKYRAFLYKRKYKKDYTGPSQSDYHPAAKTTTRGNFCPYCAKSVKPDHRYCPHCSAEL